MKSLFAFAFLMAAGSKARQVSHPRAYSAVPSHPIHPSDHSLSHSRIYIHTLIRHLFFFSFLFFFFLFFSLYFSLFFPVILFALATFEILMAATYNKLIVIAVHTYIVRVVQGTAGTLGVYRCTISSQRQQHSNSRDSSEICRASKKDLTCRDLS